MKKRLPCHTEQSEVSIYYGFSSFTCIQDDTVQDDTSIIKIPFRATAILLPRILPQSEVEKKEGDPKVKMGCPLCFLYHLSPYGK